MQLFTKQCDFNKDTAVLTFAFNGAFPEAINVTSSKTKKVVRFICDIETNLNNEFYDGMQFAYMPTEECGIKNLFLYKTE